MKLLGFRLGWRDRDEITSLRPLLSLQASHFIIIWGYFSNLKKIIYNNPTDIGVTPHSRGKYEEETFG